MITESLKLNQRNNQKSLPSNFDGSKHKREGSPRITVRSHISGISLLQLKKWKMLSEIKEILQDDLDNCPVNEGLYTFGRKVIDSAKNDEQIWECLTPRQQLLTTTYFRFNNPVLQLDRLSKRFDDVPENLEREVFSTLYILNKKVNYNSKDKLK